MGHKWRRYTVKRAEYGVLDALRARRSVITLDASEKAVKTAKKRRESRSAEYAAVRNDGEAALALCRRIRDDEAAAYSDRMKAIELIRELTAEYRQ